MPATTATTAAYIIFDSTSFGLINVNTHFRMHVADHTDGRIVLPYPGMRRRRMPWLPPVMKVDIYNMPDRPAIHEAHGFVVLTGLPASWRLQPDWPRFCRWRRQTHREVCPPHAAARQTSPPPPRLWSWRQRRQSLQSVSLIMAPFIAVKPEFHRTNVLRRRRGAINNINCCSHDRPDPPAW